MHRTFYVPRRFHPAYSLLGRWLQRATGDERRAEALFLVVLSLLLLALLLGQYLAWALLSETILAAPTGPAAVAFWLAQGAGAGLCLTTCVIGFKPAVAVTADPAGLFLKQGRRTLTLAYDEIASAGPIPALRFYRHYARYAATLVFVNRHLDELLLLETIHGPVVVGLLAPDRAALLGLLEAHRAPTFEVQAAPVA